MQVYSAPIDKKRDCSYKGFVVVWWHFYWLRARRLARKQDASSSLRTNKNFLKQPMPSRSLLAKCKETHLHKATIEI